MNNQKIKFRPILFSTPMVQALLENRKTMTRRTKGLEKFNLSPDRFRYDGTLKVKGSEKLSHAMEHLDEKGKETERYFEVIPAYEVGDVLWVRETFYKTTVPELNGSFYYKASIDEGWDLKWKPSIFMPKEACRIFLKIKAIRVERLQDISEEDCKNEGVQLLVNTYGSVQFVLGKDNNALSFLENDTKKWTSHDIWKAHWAELWCKINGRSSWDANPFVFVYEFEQIEKPLEFN